MTKALFRTLLLPILRVDDTKSVQQFLLQKAPVQFTGKGLINLSKLPLYVGLRTQKTLLRNIHVLSPEFAMVPWKNVRVAKREHQKSRTSVLNVFWHELPLHGYFGTR